MWWKLFLLSLYIAILFILSRILETVAYYEGGYLASHLLDPVSLSVRKLKMLLDQRGVSYAGVVEKQELVELVDGSGEVTEGELEAAVMTTDESTTSTSTATNFTCGSHFYEEVEDTKDGVWVVQVIHNHADTFMNHQDWKAFIKKVARFGVRTGIFDCSLDWKLCERKRWYSSRLVMALPQGDRAKDNVMLRSYTGSRRVQAVFDWVSFNLASRIRQVYDSEELRRDWFAYHQMSTSHKHRNDNTKVRVLLFSSLKIPPMFFSVLSVKFTGRARFGTVDVGSAEGHVAVKKLGLTKFPMYLIITPERNLTFGERRGEYLNYNSMALLLKSLHPEVNDLFLLSLILVNVTCWLELFITRGGLLKRLGSMLWSVGKWNCCLILLWLPVLGLFQLPYMHLVLEYGLVTLRLLSSTWLASLVRADWLWFLSLNHAGVLTATFLVFAAVMGFLHHSCRRDDPTEDITNNNAIGTDSRWVWWSLSWDRYMSYLFRPVATLTRPMRPVDLDLEVGMELLIERLAVPNFWLQPIISMDYMKELPVWRYTGVGGVDSDACSDDGETLPCGAVSDGEEGGVSLSLPPTAASSSTESLSPPFMFVCEKCRALQDAMDNPDKSHQEREEERIASESACAKFLMDGDYKCLCKLCPAEGGGGGEREAHIARHSSRSQYKQRARSLSPHLVGRRGSWAGQGHKPNDGRGGQEEEEQEREEDECGIVMPPGILPSTECVICLESYRYNVTLCGLPCGHSFHQQCIMGWLQRDNHCCPVCRWPPYKAKPCSIHQHIE